MGLGAARMTGLLLLLLTLPLAAQDPLVERGYQHFYNLDDATSARKLHNKVSEIDPSNVDARLVQGLHDYLVGSLPLGYRMLSMLVGFRADKAKGIRTIQDVAAHGHDNRVEAEIFLCVL